MTTACPIPDPIAELWRAARAWCAEAMAVLGGPAAVARAIARDAFLAAKSRLRRLESFVAKLLLIEAEHCAPPLPAPKRARRTPPAYMQAPEDPADPATWRVRFRPRLPREHRAQGRISPFPLSPPRGSTSCPQRVHADARALARRFEALRRVIADPRAAVAALARRLAALGPRAHAAARRIALVMPRHGGGLVYADACVRAVGACARWPAPDSS
jgi:hypothetical protein